MVWGQFCREKTSGEEWLSASSHRCSFPSAVITQTRAFKNRYLFSHSSGGWKVEVWAGLVPSESCERESVPCL